MCLRVNLDGIIYPVKRKKLSKSCFKILPGLMHWFKEFVPPRCFFLFIASCFSSNAFSQSCKTTEGIICSISPRVPLKIPFQGSNQVILKLSSIDSCMCSFTDFTKTIPKYPSYISSTINIHSSMDYQMESKSSTVFWGSLGSYFKSFSRFLRMPLIFPLAKDSTMESSSSSDTFQQILLGIP